MRSPIIYLFILLASCTSGMEHAGKDTPDIRGTWELIASQSIQEDKMEQVDLSGKRMIKVINDSHFAFMNHDLPVEGDSLDYYVSGGGTYSLSGNQYRESLEYCNVREWEGHEFEFTVEFKGDTLIQKGLEKIEELNVDREIIETYIRTVN